MASTCAAYGNRIEGRCFKDEVCGRLADARKRTTFDASECNSAITVRDDKVVGCEREWLRITPNREKCLVRACAADMDLAAGERRQIKHMRRLTKLKQYEIGRVYDVVSRDLPDRDESARKPLRTWSDFDAADHTRRVARAQRMLVVVNADEIARARSGRCQRDRGQAHAASRCCGNLSRHTDVAEAVASI